MLNSNKMKSEDPGWGGEGIFMHIWLITETITKDHPNHNFIQGHHNLAHKKLYKVVYSATAYSNLDSVPLLLIPVTKNNYLKTTMEPSSYYF